MFQQKARESSWAAGVFPGAPAGAARRPLTLHTCICMQFLSKDLPSCLGNSEVLDVGANPSQPPNCGRSPLERRLSRALAHLEAVSLHPLSHLPLSAPAVLGWLILGSTPQLCLQRMGGRGPHHPVGGVGGN